MKITSLFETIKTTSGSSAKAALMQANMTNVIKQIFEDTYDNQKKYFVKKFDMPKHAGKLTLETDYSKFHKLLESLA